MKPRPLTYRDSGVDLQAAEGFIRHIRTLALSTHGPDVMPSGDEYAGLYRLPQSSGNQPLIAATCDGVGTKLLVARDCHNYRGIGQDLVAMNVNDLLPRGARPLFFLDYIAVSRINSVPLTEIAEGIATACREVGCALLGGETAEMPDLYRDKDCDLAGFAVGLVDASLAPQGYPTAGDIILGLPSSGIHANGLSLARRVIAVAGLSYQDRVPGLDSSIGEELLIPTRLYVEPVLALLQRARIKAAAHITGGGLLLRMAKLATSNLRILIDPATYSRPPIFDVLARHGNISEAELSQTFNMGLGFVAVVSAKIAEQFREQPCGEWRIVGKIVAGQQGVDLGYANT